MLSWEFQFILYQENPNPTTLGLTRSNRFTHSGSLLGIHRLKSPAFHLSLPTTHTHTSIQIHTHLYTTHICIYTHICIWWTGWNSNNPNRLPPKTPHSMNQKLKLSRQETLSEDPPNHPCHLSLNQKRFNRPRHKRTRFTLPWWRNRNHPYKGYGLGINP